MKKVTISTLLFLVAIFTTNVFAYSIIFTHEGSGAGSLDGAVFAVSDFRITALGDTDDRQSFGSNAYFIVHLSASITIDGLGSYNFISPTATFINDASDLVGLTRTGASYLDLLHGPIDAAFDGWDMLTSIGPISGTGYLLQWLSPAVNTSGGILIFDNATSPVTFQASVVPEPSTFILLGAGLAGLAAWRRKRS